MKEPIENYMAAGLVIGFIAGAAFGVYEVMQTYNFPPGEAISVCLKNIIGTFGNLGKPMLVEPIRDTALGLIAGGVVGGLVAKLTNRRNKQR